MKVFFVFLISVLSTTIFAQNLEFSVIVKNVETGLVIDEVNITALKTKQAFLTNINGEANINLKSESDLKFENISYKPYVVKFADLDKKVNEIYLESNAKRLEEVILSNIPPQQILKQLVENSLKALSIPINLKVYMREFYKKNNENVFFNDGLLNFQLIGKTNSFKTDILVEQNRAMGLLDQDIKDELLGYNLNNIIENYYQFKYVNEILPNSSSKKYDYIVKSFPSNEDYLVLRVTPTDTAKGVLSDFTIIYDRNKMLILEVGSVVPENRLEELRKSYANSNKIYKLEFKNTFKTDNNLYYLANSKEVIGFEKKFKKQSRHIEVNNQMVITNFSETLLNYKDYNVYKEKSLISRKTEFFTNFWDIESGFLSTKEEKDIIEKLAHL